MYVLMSISPADLENGLSNIILIRTTLMGMMKKII